MRPYKQLLQLYKHPFTLIRLGRNADGGYIVPQELITNNLLSCGISNEISFELAYLNKINNPNIHCFDGTIEQFPSENKVYNWHKFNIGAEDNTKEISLNTIFNKYFSTQDNIFIKMDIEEGEYSAFETITKDNLKRISCLVIEVHEINKLYEKFKALMDMLNTELVLIHKHDNNNGHYFKEDNKVIPNVYELTFVNKKFISEKIKNDIKLPIEGLDFINTHCQPVEKITYDESTQRKNVIIGITSWKGRINTAYATLESLYKSVKFAMQENKIASFTIEFNLDRQNFPNGLLDLPGNIAAGPWNIFFEPIDFKVWNKIIPTIRRHYGDDYILITADDDCIYPEKYVSEVIDNMINADWLCTADDKNTCGECMVYSSSILNRMVPWLNNSLITEIQLDDHTIFWLIAKLGGTVRGHKIESCCLDRILGYSFRRYWNSNISIENCNKTNSVYPTEYIKKEREILHKYGIL